MEIAVEARKALPECVEVGTSPSGISRGFVDTSAPVAMFVHSSSMASFRDAVTSNTLIMPEHTLHESQYAAAAAEASKVRAAVEEKRRQIFELSERIVEENERASALKRDLERLTCELEQVHAFSVVSCSCSNCIVGCAFVFPRSWWPGPILPFLKASWFRFRRQGRLLS